MTPPLITSFSCLLLRMFFSPESVPVQTLEKHFSALSLESKFYGEWNLPAWEDSEYLIQLTPFLSFFGTNMVKNTNKLTRFTARGCLESSRKHCAGTLGGRRVMPSSRVTCNICFQCGAVKGAIKGLIDVITTEWWLERFYFIAHCLVQARLSILAVNLDSSN